MAPLTLTVTDKEELDEALDRIIDGDTIVQESFDEDEETEQGDNDESPSAEPEASTPDPVWPDASDVPIYIQSYLSKIRETESRAAMIAAEIDGIKEDLKSAKQRYDDTIILLRSMVRRGPDPQASLPFPDDDDATPAPVQIDQPPTTSTTVDGDDVWRAVPIVELENLAEPIKQKLLDANLNTVGELADFTASGKLLTDIKGIGDAKAEKIEYALECFWEDQEARQDREGDDDDE